MSNNNRASLLKQHLLMTNNNDVVSSSSKTNTPTLLSSTALMKSSLNTANNISTPSNASSHTNTTFDRNSSVSRLAQSASRALKARQTISFIQKQQLQQRYRNNNNNTFVSSSNAHQKVPQTKRSTYGTDKIMKAMSSSSSTSNGDSSSINGVSSGGCSSSYDESREDDNSSTLRDNSLLDVNDKYGLNDKDHVEHYATTTKTSVVNNNGREGPSVAVSASSSGESVYEEDRDEDIEVGCSYSEVESNSGSDDDDDSSSSSSESEVEKEKPIEGILRNKIGRSTSASVMKVDTTATNNNNINTVSPSYGGGGTGGESDHSNITSPPTPVATNRSSSSAITAIAANRHKNIVISEKRSASPTTPITTNIIKDEKVIHKQVPILSPPPAQLTQQSIQQQLVTQQKKEQLHLLQQQQEQQKNYNNISPLHEGQTFKRFENKLTMPGQKIKDLLTVIAIKPTGPRKMNACGAIKTLSSIPANRIKLSWTRGVIPTLSSVLNDDNSSIIEKQRCVSTLLSLIQPKINQVIILHSPSFIQGISNGLLSTCFKTKYISSQCIDILAKNDDNKFVMFDQFPLITSISDVISSNIPPNFSDPAYITNDNNEKQQQPSSNNINGPTTPSLPNHNHAAFDNSNVSKADYHGLALSARLRCLLTLRHLSRVKDIAYKFARNIQVMTTLLSVSGKMDPSANAVCIAIFADLTRHPQNSLQLVYHVSGFLKALVDAAKSKKENNDNDDDPKCRQYACYAMQNLSCNMGCRQELAITHDLLYTLSKCGLNFNYPEEQIAAIGTLKNISNDPSNFIHLSNTTTCFNTLIYLAGGAIHNKNHHTKTTITSDNEDQQQQKRHKEMLQYLACDALATLSNWIAASALAGMNVVSKNKNTNQNDNDYDSEDSDENNSATTGGGIVFTKEMMRPKLFVQPWNQWE